MTFGLFKISVRWTKPQVDRQKKSIRIELAEIEKKSGDKAKILRVNEKIKLLQEEESAKSQLDLFIYVMSALVHYERVGISYNTQIGKLSDIGFGVLQTQGIVPVSSNLAFLYG